MSIIVRHMKWLSVVILLWCSVSYAQTQSIVNIKLNADYICANQNSGEYTISFKWEGILPSNSNVFTMELSSPSGDFFVWDKGFGYSCFQCIQPFASINLEQQQGCLATIIE